jgi:hypothetical protein
MLFLDLSKINFKKTLKNALYELQTSIKYHLSYLKLRRRDLQEIFCVTKKPKFLKKKIELFKAPQTRLAGNFQVVVN